MALMVYSFLLRGTAFLAAALMFSVQLMLGKMLLPLVGAERFAATPATERAQASIQALCALRDSLWQAVKLPRTLREAGVTDKGLLPEIRDLAINDGALPYNRKDADRAQLLDLLERAWE